jgi:hypothetical protein
MKATRGVVGEVVFPDAEDGPTEVAELAVDEAVAAFRRGMIYR